MKRMIGRPVIMMSDISVQYALARKALPAANTVRDWVSATLGVKQANASLCVRFVGQKEGRQLNHQWRNVDKATNVLAFPVDGFDGLMPNLLGDVVLCVPVARREAREQGKTPRAHIAHLIIHGVLHLMGYDHMKPREQARMEKQEIAILSQLGFNDPYRIPSP